MHQGNWTCSTCGAAITELPFEFRSNKGLTFRDCHAKSRNTSASTGNQSAGAQGGDKPKVEGNWTCGGCGTAITSLPFTPRDTSNLLCIDCYKKSKG